MLIANPSPYTLKNILSPRRNARVHWYFGGFRVILNRYLVLESFCHTFSWGCVTI